MNRITIRPYQKSDYPQLCRCYDQFQDYLISIDRLKRNRRLTGYSETTMRDLLKDVKKKNGKFLVAETNGEIIGLVVAVILKQTSTDLLSIIPSTIGRILELFVKDQFRRRGIGKRLMTAAESYLKKLGCDIIWVEVFAPNHPAHNFYQKLGYHDRMHDMIKK